REPPSPARGPAQVAASAVAQDVVAAGPATRRLARALGVDLSQVQGSAPGGRVRPEDVTAHVRQRESEPAVGGASIQAPPAPDFERWGPVEHRPMDAVRRKT